MSLGHLLFQFSGRTSRGKYWLAWLIYVAIYAALVALGYFTESSMVYALTGMALIVIAISGVAVGVKRLHDRNKPGWYLVLLYALPGALFFASVKIDSSDSPAVIANALAMLAFAIGVWALVEMGCLRGTIGVNPYGPDPVAPVIVPRSERLFDLRIDASGARPDKACA